MSTIAVGDWDPEDGHKIHVPQLPNPMGWDVYATAGLEQYPSGSVLQTTGYTA
jgi:hypothetical protein